MVIFTNVFEVQMTEWTFACLDPSFTFSKCQLLIWFEHITTRCLRLEQPKWQSFDRHAFDRYIHIVMLLHDSNCMLTSLTGIALQHGDMHLLSINYIVDLQKSVSWTSKTLMEFVIILCVWPELRPYVFIIIISCTEIHNNKYCINICNKLLSMMFFFLCKCLNTWQQSKSSVW